MKYLSLFTGIGGFELGIQQAYENINRLCNCGELGAETRQDFSGKPYDLLQPCRRKNGKEIGQDNENRNSLPPKINELSQLGTESKNSTYVKGATSQYTERTFHNADGSTNRGKQADTEGNQGQGLFAEARQDASAEERPVGERPTDGTDQRPLCIGYSEIDKYAVQVYQSHFPEHKNYGDIKSIDVAELPDFDLLVGGFPCQSFSIAGKRGGFNDTRGTLFFEITRILKSKQPRLCLLENVKGLLSHDEGRTFRTIIATLDELGYDVQWQVLNSKNFGVPQNRERVFIVGHLRGTARPQVFPFTGDDRLSNLPDNPNEGQPQAEIAQTVRTKIGTRADDSFVMVKEATRGGVCPSRAGRLNQSGCP